MATPLPVWRANSRPCDCAQESEDCITACGEKPQEWTEKRKGEGGLGEEELAVTDDADGSPEVIERREAGVSRGGDVDRLLQI